MKRQHILYQPFIQCLTLDNKQNLNILKYYSSALLLTYTKGNGQRVLQGLFDTPGKSNLAIRRTNKDLSGKIWRHCSPEYWRFESGHTNFSGLENNCGFFYPFSFFKTLKKLEKSKNKLGLSCAKLSTRSAS